MPKPKNKKVAYIDKKNAVSFQLIHRSQQDPLAADADANQMVLQPIMQKVKEEEREHGVFYEDEYNYLQHLKDRNKVEHDWSEADRFVLQAEERKEKEKGLNLPTTVFGTKGLEEEVGLLNKAAPTGLDLNLDPDIVAALDEDFDFDDPDNCLEDDFVIGAMEVGEGGDSDDDEWEDGSDVDSDCGGGRSEEDDEVPSLQSWGGEETGTKFTNYSMSSSCIRRNNQLSLLDDKFDRFMDQYGELEEGALEGEEIEGTMEEGGTRMKELVEDSAKERALVRQQLLREREVQKSFMMQDSGDDSDMEEIIVKEKLDKWDCESVLSTYSTLYNHPKIISERRPDQIRLSTKTGIPKGVLGRGLTAGALKQLDMETGVLEDDMVSVRSKMSEFSIRPKHEAPEEKKARKVGLKQVRKERREEKKANTMAFKSEKNRQDKININMKNNMQGIKIC